MKNQHNATSFHKCPWHQAQQVSDTKCSIQSIIRIQRKNKRKIDKKNKERMKERMKEGMKGRVKEKVRETRKEGRKE